MNAKEIVKACIVYLLTLLARAVLARHKPYIIGVTGNLGKTSTKDAIYEVLKRHVHVRRSEKSMNSEFGVPLTVLGEKSAWNNPFKWILVLIRGLFVILGKEYPTHLVLEIGADRPGDIKAIGTWVKPDIAVVTQFGEVPVHVEFFPNRDAVIEEKGRLVEVLKESGLFIYNNDCHDSKKLLEKTKAKTMSFGIHEHADITAADVTVYGDPLEGTKATIIYQDAKELLMLPEVVGKSPVYCALPALLVAEHLGIARKDALNALTMGAKPKGRMHLLSGMNGTVIIDDSYNASPKAAEHGLKTLESIDAKGRKIAVLGDMMELGTYTRDEHYKIGKLAGGIAHKLVTVGIRSRVTAEGALDNGAKDEQVLQCDTSIEAGKELVALLQEGDVVYVKGSQSMRMERAIEMILAGKHDASSVLVRQEEEWKKR